MAVRYDYPLAHAKLDEARRALATGDFDACLTALEAAHQAGHDHGRIHLGVHLTWMQLALRTRDPRMALGQIAPVVFAVPVSVVRRATGT